MTGRSSGLGRLVGFRLLDCSVPLPAPVRIASTTLYEEESIAAELVFECGVTGWGFGVPWKPATGDSLAEVREEAAGLRPGDAPAAVFFDDWTRTIRCASLRSAVDVAVYDAAALLAGVPSYRLLSGGVGGLGGRPPRIVPNSYTVHVYDDHDTTARKVSEIFSTYPDLAVLKIKLSGRDDADRCRAAASASPAGTAYILDGNEGFDDPDVAADVINDVCGVLGNVLLVEQPTPKHDLAALATVTRRVAGAGVGAKVVADESCAGEEDLARLAEGRVADGVNIKLQKCGGPTTARRMAESCRASGMAVMFGCMLEQGQSIAAGLAVAVTSPATVVTDLDGDLKIPSLGEGRCPFRGGARLPLEVPGFGCAPDVARAERLAAEGLIRWDEMTSWTR